MKPADLRCGLVILGLLLFTPSTSPGRANKPAVEYQSLLNMRVYEADGGFLIDGLQVVFPPQGNQRFMLVVSHRFYLAPPYRHFFKKFGISNAGCVLAQEEREVMYAPLTHSAAVLPEPGGFRAGVDRINQFRVRAPESITLCPLATWSGSPASKGRLDIL
jgi:hypothetical protein